MATPQEAQALRVLLLVSLILIIIAGFFAFRSEKKRKPNVRIGTFLGFSKKVSFKSILVGMGSAMVFGFIDNAGLFFGMDALDPYLPALKPGVRNGKEVTFNKLTQAGLGNTFSDGLGAFLGSFVGVIIRNMSGITETPLWSEAVGVIVGCLLGLGIPMLLTGKT